MNIVYIIIVKYGKKYKQFKDILTILKKYKLACYINNIVYTWNNINISKDILI